MNAQLWSNLHYKRNRSVKSMKTAPEYRARGLSAADIKNMSSDELRFHEINNKQALDAALDAANPKQ